MARKSASTPASTPIGGPVELPSVDPSEDPSLDAVDPVDALLDDIDDPSGHEVLVFELEPGGRRHMLLRAGVADFDRWEFAERFGGGTYEVRLRDLATKQFGASRRFTVSPRVPRRDAAQPAATVQPAAPAGDTSMLTMLMGLIQSQAQQQTAILTALIGRPQQQSSLGELVEATKLLTGKGDRTPIGELLEGVERIQKMAGTGGGGSSDEIEIAKAFAPVLGELMKSREPARPQRVTLSQGGAGGGALPPAPPIPAAPQPATAPTTAMPAAIEQQPAGPLNAAMDTIAAIVLRVGLDNGGMLDSSAVARIGHQTMDALDIDALDALLATVPAGDLPREIVGSTPLIAREQMAQQAEALRTLEVWLRAQVEDHFNDDTAAAEPAAQQETLAHAQP